MSRSMRKECGLVDQRKHIEWAWAVSSRIEDPMILIFSAFLAFHFVLLLLEQGMK